MSIEIKMPALSPTMEEGTLAKWLVKEGDTVQSGDLLAEIETDKATMEFEAVDEGVIGRIMVPEGSEGVKVGTVIAVMEGEGGEVTTTPAVASSPTAPKARATMSAPAAPAVAAAVSQAAASSAPDLAAVPAPGSSGNRIKASPIARRIAKARGINLTTLTGTGPNGRIVKVDVEAAVPGAAPAVTPTASAPSVIPASAAVPVSAQDFGIPHEVVKLSNMRKTIARRLTESKQTVPHIYLTVDVRLDALLKLRGELNASLESRGVKLSVNDMLIKALALALSIVPECNVQFAGDQMLQFKRADISVAVSIPSGLITPIIADAGSKSISAISSEMADLASRAKAGKLAPHEYQGGTASLSNMGMMGIKQFEAVINPPQAVILGIGAGETRPLVVDDALSIATVMSATGSFDHRAIDGADGARLMSVFRELVEKPLAILA